MTWLTGRIAIYGGKIPRTPYTMTLTEKRVLLLAISKIDSTQFPKSGVPLTVSLDVSEWGRYYQDENPWRTMKRATTELLGRHVTFHPKTEQTTGHP